MGRTRQAIRELTPRQREVLELVAKGHTNAEIADLLGITLAGAKWHVSELLMRLDMDSREELAEYWASETGIRGRLGRFAAALGGLVPLKAAAGVVGGLALLSGVGVAVAVMVSSGSNSSGHAAAASATPFPTTATIGATATRFVLPGVTPPTNPMAGATPVYDQGTLANRPLVLPKVEPGGSCPVSPLSRVAADFGLAQGTGPAYVVGLQLHTDKSGQSPVISGYLPGDVSNWGTNKSIYVIDPVYTGPLFIRGARLDGEGQVRFLGDSVQDSVAFDAASPASNVQGWRSNVFSTLIPADGCYGLQVDGANFREVIVFKTQLCIPLGPFDKTTPVSLPRCIF